jgi:hypothetical protein
MSITTLARAKAHSNIYFAEKDDELQGKLDAAEQDVAQFLNRADLLDLLSTDESPHRLLAGIENLVLQLFDDYWQNKGATIVGTIATDNPAWKRAAHLYRVNLGV